MAEEIPKLWGLDQDGEYMVSVQYVDGKPIVRTPRGSAEVSRQTFAALVKVLQLSK
jgi:hypothetical protein